MLQYRFSILVVLITCCQWALAQRPGGRPGGAPAASNTEVTGMVLDSTSGDPIAYATVQLMVRDSIVNGALTNEKGRFAIQKVKPGRYQLQVVSMEYETGPVKSVEVGRGMPFVNAGKLVVAPKVLLEEVEITTQKDYMVNQIDRKVYDVTQNLTTVGGGAGDVLNTIPSVEVDLDGNVSLRGNANVTIFVDGKPSALTGSGRQAILDAIPASTIARVEVITNPSARYDPDGVSGIINIVTKKNKRAGWNGTATLSVGTRDKYSGNANLNYRNRRLNAFANYSYNLDNRWSEGITDRTSILADTTFRLFQEENGDRRRLNNVGGAGIDVFLGPRTTLGVSGNLARTDQDRSETISFNYFDENAALTERFDRITTETEVRNNYEGELNFQHKFDDKGTQLDARASHSVGIEDEIGNFGSFDLTPEGIPMGTDPELQNNFSDNAFRVSIFKVDYTKPVGKKGKLETGAQTTLRQIDNDFASESFDYGVEGFTDDVELNNRFIYREQVHAAYMTYGHSFGKLNLQGGLRAEQALTESELVTTSEIFENDYFNVFPSGFLAYKPTKKSEIRMSYSRRINRPRTRQLNPFTDFSDPANLRFGNPYLLPEYINSYEASIFRRFKSGTITSSIYYRRTVDLHTRVLTINDEGQAARTFENASSADDIGLEFITQFRPFEIWDFTLSTNLYRRSINASNVNPDLTSNGLGGGFRLLTSLRFTKTTSFQVVGNYRAIGVRPQGLIAPFFNIDLALRQQVLKGKGDIGLRVSDIFDTLKFEIDLDDPEFSGLLLRDRESRIGFLSFTYRFGKQTNQKRSRSRGGGGGMDFDF